MRSNIYDKRQRMGHKIVFSELALYLELWLNIRGLRGPDASASLPNSDSSQEFKLMSCGIALLDWRVAYYDAVSMAPWPGESNIQLRYISLSFRQGRKETLYTSSSCFGCCIFCSCKIRRCLGTSVDFRVSNPCRGRK